MKHKTVIFILKLNLHDTKHTTKQNQHMNNTTRKIQNKQNTQQHN